MTYHYSREEREAMDSAPKLTSRLHKGVFRGNRSLLIVLLDVLFIVLMFIVFRVFLYKPQSSAGMQGYAIELRVRVMEGSVFAVATIKNEGGEAAGEAAYLTFRFGDEEQRVSAPLPVERGSVEEAGVLFPYTDSDAKIEAVVRIGDQEKRLSCSPESRNRGKK